MAIEQIGTPVGRGALIDPEMAKSLNNSSSNISATVFGYTKDIAAMRTRLKAIDAGLYTDAYLDSMTANDMLFAIMQKAGLKV